MTSWSIVTLGLLAQCRCISTSRNTIVAPCLGDRSCLALAMLLNVPALTADREWKRARVKGLKVEHIR